MKLFLMFMLMLSSCTHVQAECGGLAGIKCEEGYVCELHDPQVADGFGTCVPH